MKRRAMTLAFTACLVSSLAFADNPTDAQLMPNDGNTTVAQQENRAGDNRQHPSKNDQSRSPKAKNENPSENNRQGERSNPLKHR